MCGIVGRILRNGRNDPALIARMRDRLTHPGPDAAGLWLAEDRRVALAHRRLSIIDLSPAGRQPMTDAAGELQITFNGEIYNYRELRDQLTRQGHRFLTATDTEVILAAWREWGE